MLCESSLLFMAVMDPYLHSMNTQGNFIKAVDPVPGRCTAAQFTHKFASRNFPGGPVAKTPHSQCRGPPSTSNECNGIPLQYSCLQNPMDGGAWWAAVHGVSKSRTGLSDFTFTFHFHALEKEMATWRRDAQ